MNDYFGMNNANNYWVQQANQREDTARSEAQDAINKRFQAEANNQNNVDLIISLRQRNSNLEKNVGALKAENAVIKSEKEFFENLLSRPMKEIAEKNKNFKETYDEQQLVLSKWILSQKAYAETAVQIGLESGKTKEEIDKIYKDNVKNVLANTTQHDNDSSSNAVLKENVGKIVKRK
jgi:hypothetical protein